MFNYRDLLGQALEQITLTGNAHGNQSAQNQREFKREYFVLAALFQRESFFFFPFQPSKWRRKFVCKTRARDVLQESTISLEKQTEVEMLLSAKSVIWSSLIL